MPNFIRVGRFWFNVDAIAVSTDHSGQVFLHPQGGSPQSLSADDGRALLKWVESRDVLRCPDAPKNESKPEPPPTPLESKPKGK